MIIFEKFKSKNTTIMKTASKFLFILTFISASIFILTSCNNSGSSNNSEKDSTDTEQKKEENTHKVHWAYEGEAAPEAWATLCEEYADCSGKVQSPVDISTSVKDATLKPLYLDYVAVKKLDILNNGHSVQVNYNAGVFVIENVEYHLLQFHFHCPSEYTFNGEHFPMEVHLVHADADGNLAVIGVMVKEGAENQFFKKFWDKLPAKECEVQTYDVEFDANSFLPADKGYYHLIGSLTTPPCTEGVKWFVLKTPVEASKAQIEKIVSCMPKNNNRPVQPLNDRVIKEF